MDQNPDPENGWFWTKNDQSIETKIVPIKIGF